MATGEGQLAPGRVDAADHEGQALVGRFVGNVLTLLGSGS
jgi:hypothetical protein